MKITLADIFNLSGSVIYNPAEFKAVSSVSTDTRTIRKNSLYVAIKGARFDGHKFVDDAINKGASAILINKRKLNNYDHINIPIITVPDTIKAYGELAHVWRSKLKAKVISITGSNGKTTTKEILAVILSEKFKTEKSLANNNNHIGVPLTILSAKTSCEVLIIEHGTNHFNEIKYTAEIASPDYALITNIGDSHLEYLIDQDGVYKEKSALFNSALANNGTIFVNNDSGIIKKNTKNVNSKVTFGFKGRCDVKGKITGYTENGRTKLSVSYKNRNYEVTLPIYGKSNAHNVLAAIAVAQHLKLSVKQIKSGVSKLEQIPGRLSVQKFNNMMLIDDTYNANPASMEAAIILLKEIKSYKVKTIIIGDMFELGSQAVAYHKSLAGLITKNKINNVMMIGKLLTHLDKELQKIKTSININYFKNRRALKSFINKNDFSGQVILVKGSRGMKMEEFAEQIRNKAA